MATGPSSAAESDSSTTHNSVFIDTSLNTHLAMIFSQNETVSDLKKRILYEHPLCFPSIGDIKIVAIKVKRRGHFYHLSDSMFVKSAFVGINKNWFLYVDASSVEGPSENQHSMCPDSSAACIGVMNKSLADGNNILVDGLLKRCANPDDLLLPQLDSNRHVKQKVGTSESRGKVPKGVGAAAAPIVDSQSKISSVNNIRSDPNKPEKCLQFCEEKEIPESQTGCQNEDIRNEVNAEHSNRALESVSKTGTSANRNCRVRKKIDSLLHDHAPKESNASASTSYDNASHQEVVITENPLGNKGRDVSYGMQIEKDIADGQCMSFSSETSKTLGTPNEKTNVLCEVVVNEQSNNSLEDASHSTAVAKRSRKSKKKKVDEDSLDKNRALFSDPNEGVVAPGDEQHRKSFDDTLESRPSLVKKHDENKESTVDPSSEKDDRRDKGVAVETNPNNLSRKSEQRGQGAMTSETSTALRKKRKHDFVQEVSEVFRSPGADVGNVKSKQGASDLTIAAAVGRIENSKDHQKPDDPKKDAAVSSAGGENIVPNGHQECRTSSIHRIEEQIEPLQNNDGKAVLSEKVEATSGAEEVRNTEEVVFTSKSFNVKKTVVPGKSSKKKRNSRADKDSVGGSLLTSGTEHLKGSPSGISLIDPHQAVIADHSSKKAKENENNVPPIVAQKVPEKKSLSTADLATDSGIDDVIKSVVESVQQVNEHQVNAEILGKKLRKKSKKKRSNAKDLIEFQTDVEDFDNERPAPSTDCQSSMKLNGKQRNGLRTPAGNSGTILPQESSFKAENAKGIAIRSEQKSLLATSGTIFKDDSVGSSDNKGGGQDSDSSTKTPSDNSASDGESNANVNSPLIAHADACNGESQQGMTELVTASAVGRMGNAKDHHLPNNLKEDIEVTGGGVEHVIINNREECRTNETRGVERERDLLLNNDRKAVTSETSEPSCSAKEDMNTKDVVLPHKSLYVNENVDPEKSSKKNRRYSKNEDLVGGAQPNTEEAVVVTSKSLDANETVDLRKSSRKKKKTRTTGDLVSRTPLASNAENVDDSVTDKDTGDEIRSVVESVKQISKNHVSSENLDEKSGKKSKKKRKSSEKRFPEYQEENENVGPRGSMPSTNVAKPTDLVETGSMNQLNGSNVEYDTYMNAVIVKGSQVSLHSLEDNNKDKPLQAVVDGDPANNSCAHEATSEVFVGKVPKAKGENKLKSKKNKNKLDTHSNGPSPDSQGSLKVNGKQLKTQAGNSGITLSHGSSLKDAYDKLPLHVKNKSPEKSGKNDARELPSKKSDKLNYIPEEVKKPAVVNASRTSSYSVKKGGSQAVSTSSLKHSKMITARTRRDNGGEPPADRHVALRKDSSNRVGHIVNSSEHKKSLLATSGGIFQDDTDSSSEGGGHDSDGSTRTPSDNSSTGYSVSDDEINSNQALRGRNEDSGKIIKPLVSSGAKGLAFEAILRRSSGFKKAKLTASQFDSESQPVDFVPDSQANL
ncbi:hypothetical protein HS088_TW06G00690 [Tripterygium wilfordii]|uniref:Uncharacterized protein n=1 Tax=Tripterygium wilfordii TaxID=458696 RepID=A0A7J7DJQ9_TRIWF|nr:uncharacterized protein LOC119999613 isoform X2 [Tripterygium wilfordii]KAF5746519.1 hypothetical protein HS088_TW06G00690 [Tripterygium wilfordii]